MSEPCSGLTVVELAADTSEIGLGLAAGVPGMVLADLGAAVTRVVGRCPPPIDGAVPWGRVWHRNKKIVECDDPEEIRGLVAGADVALVYGSEQVIEQRGLGWADLRTRNPRLVYARCRPSRTSGGSVADYSLLVEASAGFCTQLPGHRAGPTFVDVRASGSGAAFVLTATSLALLRRRELTGEGGWSETSLYDGMLATLGCMIGRSESGGPGVETYWEKGSWFPNFMYRCSDGELVQVWFGGKGMYASLIEVLGDEPSEQGYYADQAAGQLGVRAERWRATFARRPRDEWIELLRAAGVACEPVLSSGQALRDPHLAEIGLSVRDGTDCMVGTPIRITPLQEGGERSGLRPTYSRRGLLDGLKVVDFSMFVAGPLAGQLLADLGADVIKVEPPQGEAMRGAAYAMAACQRGKRSLAMDINAPEARPVVERLLRWADVVLHNFRVGVSERLGIDEASVARINPGAVYCHASAFGSSGPRARFPGNDALMQALTGFEQAVGGSGNDPVAATWIPIDMSGGWVAACGILAALYARAVTGQGQRVATSLLGAGMLLQSGAYEHNGEVVRGPQLDGDQTGYGPGYRIYRCADDRWLALVVPDREGWQRLRGEPELASLAAGYTPLRTGSDAEAALLAEEIMAGAFASRPRDEWVSRLRALRLPVAPVEEMDRNRFRQGILDDPVNRQLGRVIGYETADWGFLEQIGPLMRCGPDPSGAPPLRLPGIGQHTVDVLAGLGFEPAEIDSLLATKAVRE